MESSNATWENATSENVGTRENGAIAGQVQVMRTVERKAKGPGRSVAAGHRHQDWRAPQLQ